MKVILISGKARHGKDTAAGFLADTLRADGYSVLIAHYGDLVKYVCKTFFGWDGEKDECGRSLLQYIGTDSIRAQRPDYWVSFIASIIELFPDEWDYVLIPDCRFPNEIDYIKNAGFNTIHLRIARSGFESPLTSEQQMHPSETALDSVKPDCFLLNNGSLEDLQNAVFRLMPVLTSKEVCA